MSYLLEVPAGAEDIPTEPPQETPKQLKSYNPADLDEFCLWLYGLYEEEVVNS